MAITNVGYTRIPESEIEAIIRERGEWPEDDGWTIHNVCLDSVEDGYEVILKRTEWMRIKLPAEVMRR